MINVNVISPNKIFDESNKMRTEADIIVSFVIERFNKLAYDKAQQFSCQNADYTEQVYRFYFVIPRPLFIPHIDSFMECITNIVAGKLELAGWQVELCNMDYSDGCSIVIQTRCKTINEKTEVK